MSRKIKIALAEDQSVNRNTFIRKAEQMENCELVFVAANGNDCLDQLKGLPESKRPEVIFMDLEMPGLDGIKTIALAHNLYPSIHFLVLTVFDDDDKIFEAIKAGAEGYLLKYENYQALEDAVRNVLEFGGAPMSAAIARKTLKILQRSAVAEMNQTMSALPEDISERELQVLQWMVSGMDAKSIATQMELSVHTVRKHIANIYNKLHVSSKAQVISLAHKEGWFRER